MVITVADVVPGGAAGWELQCSARAVPAAAGQRCVAAPGPAAADGPGPAAADGPLLWLGCGGDGCEQYGRSKCGACGLARYCSVACQKKGARAHRLICPLLARGPDAPSEEERLEIAAGVAHARLAAAAAAASAQRALADDGTATALAELVPVAGKRRLRLADAPKAPGAGSPRADVLYTPAAAALMRGHSHLTPQ